MDHTESPKYRDHSEIQVESVISGLRRRRQLDGRKKVKNHKIVRFNNYTMGISIVQHGWCALGLCGPGMAHQHCGGRPGAVIQLKGFL